MNKKVLILLLLGIVMLNGCKLQSLNEKEKQNKEDIVAKVKVDEDEKSKKQETDSKKEDEEDSKTKSFIDKNNSSEPKKETSKTNNIDTFTTAKVPQTTTNDKPSNPATQPDVEQPNPPVVEQVPEQPKEEVVQPIKQDSMANSVMSQINSYRIQNGLQPLNSSQYYQDKANAHALDMANKRTLWHSDNGECITNHPDPFNAWINSPEHREIILTKNNTIGVVSIYYVDGYYYSVFSTAW
ncbi:CAP domain-containing protein [Thomasclavelia ramosa]|uniref:CAP domain-containing protein n=1 Tax=Thomasclavelia ramosa TaxID=1547 RepID=UPI001D0769EF|nr:CAP domain-containing protein [Thomasclavelia ramosa]MCB6435834.1 CAP domain-containing protein [Thomasclavelia ramosa]MCB6458883.1 CAP domain-containing protein [Thomasclavelia ramosa]MCB6597137.1 CAP domain-containing protein [Thomasclavelia ramosa]MCB6600604.1 CAP domain-containing protein [Thomasclavelia ramosa]MCB6618717.1 CAP domain-containing protein [Thomasclavelia ramosa]